MLPRPIVSRLGWFIFCFALITTAVIIISRPTATASVTTTEFDLSHIDIVAHLNVSGTTELERLLATNPANLGFFAANMPGTQAYDGGWAIIDLNQLDAGVETALITFQPSPIYYEAGGVASDGHFAALREDARIWAENNRNDVVVYDVSNPAEPMLYGEFRLEKPPEVWRNIIYDMVIYGDRAYLKAVVLGTVPDFDFRGIIVVDLSSPDPDTQQLPELARYAYPVTSPLLSLDDTLYAASEDGTIYVFKFTPDFHLVGTYAAGSNLMMDLAYEGGVIGRIDDQPTLIDFAAGGVDTPVVKPIFGGTFAAETTTGDLLWGQGRGHDTVAIWLEDASDFLYGFTVGSVDASVRRAAVATTAPMTEGDYLLVDWTDLYRLRQDGWRPHAEILAVEPGLEVNGLPLSPGERVTIETGCELVCQLAAQTHAGNDTVSSNAPSAVDGACESAVAAVCADGSEAQSLFGMAAVLQANTYCTYLENHIDESYEDCIEPAVYQYMWLYWYALSLLCGGSPIQSASGNMAVAESDAVLRFDLPEGGYTVASEVDGLVFALDTPYASATATGPGSIEAFVYLPAEASVFVATDTPLTIKPDNPTLATFTLEPGQIVGVTADDILPLESSAYTVFLPFVDS
ncbi:MAG: hypothetical protein M9928_21895 [Anaerolineae bacterium]|nr:hypothetical protein [Anaerolineae bacterium]